MRAYFRLPTGELRGYEVDTQSPDEAIRQIRQHDANAASVTILAVINGGKPFPQRQYTATTETAKTQS